jgi:hypothetical protein
MSEEKEEYKKNVEERVSICEKCEHNAVGICKKCGCIIYLKTQMMSSACPIGKWSVMRK